MSQLLVKKKISGAPGMATFIWGPVFWNIMTDIAIQTDRHWNKMSLTDKKICIQFWALLRDMLPCKWCRKSYRKFFREDPPTYPLKKWFWNLKNKVNTKLEKPHLEFEKFERRIHVYSSFSCTDTWWDMHFILALNYDQEKKRDVYKKWFEMMETLVKFIPHYNIQIKSPPNTIFTSKFTLIRWLSEERGIDTEFAIRKYAQAIAHNTVEELLQICGPLILKCRQVK